MAIPKTMTPDEYLKANNLKGFDNELVEKPSSGSPTFTQDRLTALMQPTDNYIKGRLANGE